MIIYLRCGVYSLDKMSAKHCSHHITACTDNYFVSKYLAPCNGQNTLLQQHHLDINCYCQHFCAIIAEQIHIFLLSFLSLTRLVTKTSMYQMDKITTIIKHCKAASCSTLQMQSYLVSDYF